MRTKRRLTRLAAAALAVTSALGLAACGSDSSSGNTLTIWYAPGSVPKASLDVQKQFPNLHIKLIPTPNLETKLKTTLQTGSGLPDVVVIGNDISSYAEIENKFVDLKTLGADPSKDYVPWKWSEGTTPDGRVIGFPIDTGPQGLFYRPDLFAKAGLPTDPTQVSALVTTWDGYTTIAQRAAAAGFKACDDASQVYFLQLEQKGQGDFSTSGAYLAGNALSHNAFDYAANLLTSGECTKATAYTTDWSSSVAQNVLGAFVGPVYEGPLLTSAGSPAGLWRVANPPGGPGSKGGSFMSILSSSTHQSDAYQIVKWMMSAQNQASGFVSDGLFPSALGAFTDPQLTAPQPYFGGQATGVVFAKAVQDAPAITVSQHDNLVENVISNALTAVAQGKQSAAAAWATAQADIAKQLNG